MRPALLGTLALLTGCEKTHPNELGPTAAAICEEAHRKARHRHRGGIVMRLHEWRRLAFGVDDIDGEALGIDRARPLAGKPPCDLRTVRLHGLGRCGRKGSPGDVEDVVGLAATIEKSLVIGRTPFIWLTGSGP